MFEKFKDQITQIEDGKFWAQALSVAPFAFQAARCLRDLGILKELQNAQTAVSEADLLQKIDITAYSLRILLDAGESAFIVERSEGGYTLTKSGHHLLNDRLTNVNMNFTQDVCYQGIADLEHSLTSLQPKGLKTFGKWSTIYEGLTQLPAKVLKSWLEFDHFYSDDVFPRAIPIVFKGRPKRILDVGGNTGKFALACCEYNSEVKVTILDHPRQIEMALTEAKNRGFADRIDGCPLDLLDHSVPFPSGYDVIWMSQFLDCFGEDDVGQLLKRAAAALDSESALFILEPFSDRQRYLSSKFCVDMLSLYFTALANGKSRFYRLEQMRELLDFAGLQILGDTDLRLSHTLLKCGL